MGAPTQLTSWVRRTFQVTVSVREVLTRPTPGALATLQRASAAARSTPYRWRKRRATPTGYGETSSETTFPFGSRTAFQACLFFPSTSS
jgi:hypothetical protein